MKNYYGSETIKAMKNFPFSTHPVKGEFIMSLALIKKSACLANFKTGKITLSVKNAIIKSCDEILNRKHNNQFLISSLQGGAGTATNMNINEVIANRATEILKNKIIVHPLDHVNYSQSTNDVNPSALKISSLFLLKKLDSTLILIIESFLNKAKEFENILKLGRTHLQDAVPTTLGSEFRAYAYNLIKHQNELKSVSKLMLDLNLGGTAIGNSINTNPLYVKEIYFHLNKLTGEKFLPAKNLMSQTSSQTDFLLVSQRITALMVELSKIANDIKFMSSGPNGGIGEIILPNLQKGSSIIPGKINPILPEMINQLYYLVSGNNMMIEKATEGAEMELGVMMPIITDKLLESLILTIEGISVFNEKCVKKIKADKEQCLFHLENSTAYATLLVPILGYDLATLIVEESLKSGRKLRDVIIEDKYLTNKEFDKMIFNYLKKL